MAKFGTTLLVLVAITGCSQQSDDTSLTELEGEWRGQCTTTTTTFPATNSINYVLIYESNTSTHHVNEYSDINCNLLVKQVPVLGRDFNPSTDGVDGVFQIGDLILAQDGVTAKELIYTTASGQTLYDIYLLQNNNSTLILGVKCPPPSGGFPSACNITRPTALNYSGYYTKHID